MRHLPATVLVVAMCLSGCTATTATPADNGPAAVQTSKPEPTKKEKPKTDRKQKDDKPTSRQTPRAPRKVVTYLVTDVVDGDTVKVAMAGETSIRIIGIDTPETVHPSEPIECGGPEASAAATRLLAGQRVQVVYDASQGRLDAYDRTLAYLTIPGIGDFGLAMLKRGLAAEYTYDSAYRHQSQYVRAESRAQSSGVGSGGDVEASTRPKPSPSRRPLLRPVTPRPTAILAIHPVSRPIHRTWTAPTSTARSPLQVLIRMASTPTATGQAATPSRLGHAAGRAKLTAGQVRGRRTIARGCRASSATGNRCW